MTRRFEEWWMDNEFNPMIYGAMEAAYNAGKEAVQAELAQAQQERKPVMPDFQMSENECGYCSGTVHDHSPDCLLHQDNIGEKP